jgi:hypothetical protein
VEPAGLEGLPPEPPAPAERQPVDPRLAAREEAQRGGPVPAEAEEAAAADRRAAALAPAG